MSVQYPCDGEVLRVKANINGVFVFEESPGEGGTDCLRPENGYDPSTQADGDIYIDITDYVNNVAIFTIKPEWPNCKFVAVASKHGTNCYSIPPNPDPDFLNRTDGITLSPDCRTVTYDNRATPMDISHVEMLICCGEPIASICILPGAQVQTLTGFKLIQAIQKGDYVLDEFNKPVQIINNAKFSPDTKKVISFEPNSLNFDLPTSKLEITYGHPIKLPTKNKSFTKNGIVVQHLVNDKSVTIDKRYTQTYTLITKYPSYVMINGIPVGTWAEDQFNLKCKEYREMGYSMHYSLI